MLSLHPAWGAPLFIAAILALLYIEIQWAAFVGAAAMLVLAPASAEIGKALGTLRMQIVGLTDQRTSYMEEIINGIRVLKFYAWELPFRCVACTARQYLSIMSLEGAAPLKNATERVAEGQNP